MVLQTLHNSPGSKLPEVAKQFNIPEGTLRGWFDEDRRQKAAEVAAQGPPEGVADIVDLPDTLLVGNEPQPEAEAETRPKKKRRQRYSNETKIQVILALETRPNGSLNDVAKEFKVAAGTVRGWREEADKIQKQAIENRRVGAKANPSRDPLRKIWEAILNLFEKNSRLPPPQRLEVNVAVVRTIGKQARDVLLEAHAKKPFLSPSEVTNMEKFKASETWARKWARDHQVISAKPQSGGQVEIAQHRLIVLQKAVSEFPPSRVYTMTSTALFYRILPHRTYVSKLPDDTRVRACKGLKSKDRLTLYLCTNEAGTDKLPITCIGKYDNPACFQVKAQKRLPYLSQKQALSDAGTFQRWWRTVFLPHVRNRFAEGEKCLLLVEDTGPCKADLLKDPTGQIRVEALPASQSNTMTFSVRKDTSGTQSSQSNNLPQCQALEYGILETIKRRYRYRLLQEVMEAFDERANRRKVADDAGYPMASRGLREGSLANLSDSMRLLEAIWEEVATTTVSKAWQRTKLRPKSKDDQPMLPPGTRAKSEKRQTTREKKQLIRDLNGFLKKYEARDFSKEGSIDKLEEMIEKLKNCFLYTDGEVIEAKEMMESLEEWVGLEWSTGMVSLFMEEIKKEMNIEYLVGIKTPLEGTAAEADEDEDVELPEKLPTSETTESKRGKQEKELDLETALTLATTIKATACKLFQHGDILGELALRLDDASDSVFKLLRTQKEQAAAKVEADIAKANAKKKAAARAAERSQVEGETATEGEKQTAVEEASNSLTAGSETNQLMTDPIEGESEPVLDDTDHVVAALAHEEVDKEMEHATLNTDMEVAGV